VKLSNLKKDMDSIIQSKSTDIAVKYSTELYDHYTSSFTADYDDILIKRVEHVYKSNSCRPQLLVDVGTGTAQLLIKLGTQGQCDQLKMIGTDLFDEMVVAANNNVEKFGLTDQIRIVREDVHAMSFSNSVCDLVTSRATIHHWRDPVQALREIYRLLKPNGIAIIHDIRRDAKQAMKDVFQANRVAAGIPRCNFSEKFTPEEVKTMVIRANTSASFIITAPNKGPAALGFELFLRKHASN